MSPTPSGKTPRVGTQATSETPELDARVGGLENELGRIRDARVAKAEERVFVRLSGAGIYDVPHTLGRTPILCELKQVVSAVGASEPAAAASPVRQDEWNQTLCRMRLFALVGSLDNCIATFVVKGG